MHIGTLYGKDYELVTLNSDLLVDTMREDYRGIARFLSTSLQKTGCMGLLLGHWMRRDVITFPPCVYKSSRTGILLFYETFIPKVLGHVRAPFL